MEEKRLSTKELILQKSKELFYENGIENTAFDAVANELNISKGLITYHFKNKKNLMLEVRAEIMRYLKNTVARRYYTVCGDYDLEYATATEMRVLVRWMVEDRKVFRFFYETSLQAMDTITEQNLQFYRLHQKKYHRIQDESGREHELELVTCAAKSAVNGLVACYYNGLLPCDYETFADFRVRVPFLFLKVSEERIAQILEKSKRWKSSGFFLFAVFSAHVDIYPFL